MWTAVKAFIGLSEMEEEKFAEGLLDKTSPKIPVEKNGNKHNVTLELLHSNQSSYFRKKSGNQQPQNMAIKIANSFDDAQKLADFIKNRCPLIVNLNNLDQSSNRRLTAFLSGVAYALNAKGHKLQGKMILFTPADMTISADSNEKNIFAKNAYSPVEIEEDVSEDVYSSEKFYFSS